MFTFAVSQRLLLFSLLFTMAACRPSGNPGPADVLRDVESYMDARPDSALAVLRAIPKEELHSRKHVAKAALLHSMALEKSSIYLRTDSIISPAVSYYSKHGSPDEKLKTYYYQGRIFQNAREYEKTAYSFGLAEEWSTKSQDNDMKGILFLAKSVLARDTYNSTEEVSDILRGKRFFQIEGKKERVEFCDGRLAMAYHRKKEWDKADSLYLELFQTIDSDHPLLPILLSDWAKMKVLQPEPDPNGAIQLLERKYKEYPQNYTLGDSGVYAFAAAQCGRLSAVDSYLDYIHSAKDIDRTNTDYWEYRIELIRGNSEQAILAMNSAYSRQLNDFEGVLNQSVSASTALYLEQQAERAHHHVLLTYAMAGILFLLFAALLSVSSLAARQRQMKKDAEIRDLSLRMDQHVGTIEDLEGRIAEMVTEGHAAMDFGFDAMDRLCESYYTSGRIKDQKLLHSFELLLTRFRLDGEYRKRFEERVDSVHDGIISRLNQQIPDLSKEDRLLFTYVVSGLSYNSISVILESSKPQVYNRVSRLRQQIEKSGAEDASIFLAAIRRTPSFRKNDQR